MGISGGTGIGINYNWYNITTKGISKITKVLEKIGIRKIADEREQVYILKKGIVRVYNEEKVLGIHKDCSKKVKDNLEVIAK